MGILRAYFSYFGRLNRADYAIVLLSSYIALGALLYVTNANANENEAIKVCLVVVMLWVLFAALAKRFQDINKTGWASLALLIPVVGAFTPFILLFWPGTEGKNDYGEPEKYFFR